MKEIPVYIFTGFLESGKTRFLREILVDPDFTQGERSLLLLCEQGTEELTEQEMYDGYVFSVPVEEQSALNPNALTLLEKKFKPDRVLIEYNGMWKLDDLLAQLPENWPVYQIVTVVDASTFQLYSSNLGPQMFEHITTADLVVFNRCTPALKEMLYEKNIRAMNPKATIFLDGVDGSTEDYNTNMPLPFDIDAPVIEVKDMDYGLWYIDAMSAPEKYDGKTITFKGMVYVGKNVPKGSFIPGRFGMVCCAEDVTFLGFLCRYDQAETLHQRDWIRVTATITVEELPQYRGAGPVLHAVKVEKAAPPVEELVYFSK